jgi:hypothetical protein
MVRRDHQELRVQLVPQVLKDLLELPGPRVPKDHQARKDHQELRVQLDHRALLVLQAPRAPQVRTDHRDPPV